MNAVASATIVMYHVVRPEAGLAATLKGLDASTFRSQLEYIRARHTPVNLFDLAEAAAGGQPLPPRPAVLTFDDGYTGHFDLVFPLLQKTRTPATFFPVAASLIDRRLLDVNRIQLLLATGQLAAILSSIDRAIDGHARDGATRADYESKFFHASRWDSAEVTGVKRLLQFALPEDLRRQVLDDLFHRFVSADERAIAEELYMSVDDARQLSEGGMTIGAHGDQHLRLSTLALAQQAQEIDGALRVLDAVGLPRRGFAYSYANGDYDANTLTLLRARGCRIGVTTRPAVASIVESEILTLPRLDTNDLPPVSSAASDGSAPP
jgi:peptidoglycan/xylan/chitin deacetylase (PgdA/CDA1 family)